MKLILLFLIGILFTAYFITAMVRNNPFNIPSDLNSTTTVLDEYVFKNNKGKPVLSPVRGKIKVVNKIFFFQV